jgi:hypothetical protein
MSAALGHEWYDVRAARNHAEHPEHMQLMIDNIEAILKEDPNVKRISIMKISGELNNNYRTWYSRKICQDYPQYAKYIRSRIRPHEAAAPIEPSKTATDDPLRIWEAATLRSREDRVLTRLAVDAEDASARKDTAWYNAHQEVLETAYAELDKLMNVLNDKAARRREATRR